ncbi:MAG: cell division protein FtsL [Gammaproteobacteria bacterium]|jgi:cell division protein FtsL|nr:cell division protein FtsL [Gammaproteobacteria bacterium]
MRPLVVVAALALGVFASAIATVYARHEARAQFSTLQSLIAERDELVVEWGQLQLEQSAYSTHALVERLARQKMAMRPPAASEVLVVSQ